MKILKSNYLSLEQLKESLERTYKLPKRHISKYIINYKFLIGGKEVLRKIPNCYGIYLDGILYIHPDAIYKHIGKQWKKRIKEILTSTTFESSYLPDSQ